MAEKKVRLGIIGLGAEGGMYATFLSEGKVPNMTIGAIAERLSLESSTAAMPP